MSSAVPIAPHGCSLCDVCTQFVTLALQYFPMCVTVSNARACACVIHYCQEELLYMCFFQAKVPTVSDPLLGSPCPKSKKLFRTFLYQNTCYQIGDSVFVAPGTFDFKEREEEEATKKASEQRRDQTSYDVDLYPELYRKTKLASDYIKGSNLECPASFEIGECAVGAEVWRACASQLKTLG